MLSKTVACPHCKNKVMIHGSPGEKILLSCPKCNNQGAFTFPKEKEESTISGSNVIEVKNLTKLYNGFKAVDNISFQVKKGDVFGFLGPNGAGKTTTINMLTSILKPSNGTAIIYGYDILKDPIELKKHIGFMPDVPGFYEEMKAKDVLDFYAEFYRIPKEERKKKIDELLEMMQLTEFKNKKVKTYSRGMKQKLGFASSLLNDPEVLILDEPTIGLDPSTVHFFRKSIKSLNKKGVTIFLSSHILFEIQAMCNKVGIINHGKIVAVDTIKSLGAKLAAKEITTVFVTFENISNKAIKAVKEISGVITVKENKEDNRLEIEIEAGKSTISMINKKLVEHNVGVIGIHKKELNLEDIFLSLIGGS